MLLVLFIRALKYRAQQRATTAQQREPGIKGFFRSLVPHSHYNAELLSARQNSAIPTGRPSAEFFGHELQDEEEQRGNRMSNNRLSVRSIMTLPPYHVAPLPSERLIAREGEREGVDTVVEYPESDNEVEERREEEMQALFSIREARRRENEERAARRAERRAALAQRDMRRVNEIDTENRLRNEARAASTANAPTTSTLQDSSSSINLETVQNGAQPDSALLIAQLHSLRDHNSRNRRVSSVSYADLGVARHDGSRLRADSTESDRRPLLDSAASIGGQEDRSRASSIASGRSASRSRATLHVSHNRHPSATGSFVSQHDGTLTPQSMADDLPPEPPSYEDDLSVHGGEAPPYEGPGTAANLERQDAAHTSSMNRNESSPPPMLVISSVEESQSTSGRIVSSTNDSPSLHLETTTNIVPPSIEVVQATPIIPSSQSFSPRRGPTAR